MFQDLKSIESSLKKALVFYRIVTKGKSTELIVP